MKIKLPTNMSIFKHRLSVVNAILTIMYRISWNPEASASGFQENHRDMLLNYLGMVPAIGVIRP